MRRSGRRHAAPSPPSPRFSAIMRTREDIKRYLSAVPPARRGRRRRGYVQADPANLFDRLYNGVTCDGPGLGVQPAQGRPLPVGVLARRGITLDASRILRLSSHRLERASLA